MDADAYARGIREELAAQKAELDEKKKSLYAEAEAESERIRTEADEYSKNIRAEADQYRMDAQKVVKELVSNHEWLMKGLQ
jgi:regulator of protease activity HflC (stomatin/prohibitin superfamily)